MIMGLPLAITKDLRWKLISLALAGAIWGAVYNITSNKQGAVANPLSPRVERTFTRLPVLVVSSAADVRECKVQPEYVAVTIRGASEIMAQVTEREIEVRVDLADIESARNLRKRVIVSTPPGVTFLSVAPAEVEVVIPAKKNK
jgi:YbbR domain-containing protein